MICIIAGTSLIDSPIFKLWSDERLETPYGETNYKRWGNYIYLQRHGNPPRPPHRINHHANIWALSHLGVEKIIAINSVGSLKTQLKPGMFIIPDDFISLWTIPTFHDDDMNFFVPIMDKTMALYLFDICKSLQMDIRLGGVYIQTTGPRLETRAEINLLKRFGDVVGMTMASEATLCIENHIKYASVCSVDNYCNGIAKTPLTMDEIDRCRGHNIKLFEDLIDFIVKRGFS